MNKLCPCCDAEKMGGSDVLALFAYGASVGAVYGSGPTGELMGMMCPAHREPWFLAMVSAVRFLATEKVTKATGENT